MICELHRTRGVEAAEIADIYTMATPNYRVMESFEKAKDVGSAMK